MKEKKKLNILVAAGGTGGHLFPALAVVEQLEKLTDGNVNISFVGTSDRIESRIIPERGNKLYTIPIAGLTGGLSINTILLPFKLLNSIFKCLSIIKKNKIDAVIAAGAYISYPPGLAAYWGRVPLFLMESNVNPGKTNRLLSRKASLIFTAFDESASYFKSSDKNKLRPYGNPVRNFILNPPDKKTAREKFGLYINKKTLLIFGGSLGARSINNAVEKSLKYMQNLDIQVIWQTGKNYVLSEYIPSNFKVLQFIDDMASAYAASDLVISRSGATTVSELCIAGKPSILVPLPSASNKEQEKNAQVLLEHRAAIIINDNELIEKLNSKFTELINDDSLLNEMGDSVKRLGKPLAALNCAKEILSKLGYF